MESATDQEGLLDMEKQLERHRRAVRRVDAALMVLAVIVATGVLFLPGMRERTDFSVVIPIVAAALIAAVAVLRFPWHRYDPNRFVIIGVVAVAMISFLVWATGGRESPFYFFYFFLAASAGAYHRKLWPLALTIGLCILGAGSFLVYTRPVETTTLVFFSILVLVLVTVAMINAVFFRSLASTAELLEKRVRELTALNNMFQEHLRQEQTALAEPNAPKDYLERIRADVARLDDLLRRASS
ncbi:MAG: hypothetical protein HY671_08445 [Chloroflexi bacterium]|nr:hypothetical protein [Chloroflexota bacterium]